MSSGVVVVAKTANVVATAGASVALFGLTPWAWAAALIGSCASLYFDPAKDPKTAIKTVLGILATAFAAGMVALIMPDFAGIFSANAKQHVLAMSIEARAGIMGLVIRFIMEQGRLYLSARRKNAEEGAK